MQYNHDIKCAEVTIASMVRHFGGSLDVLLLFCLAAASAGAPQTLGNAANSSSKAGTPAAADAGLQQNGRVKIRMNETIMLKFCFGRTSAGNAASQQASPGASTAQQQQQEQANAQKPSDCSNCSRCTSDCRMACCARFASQSKVIADVSSVAGLNPCTLDCARACGLLPAAMVPADLKPNPIYQQFAAATSAPAAIEQEYQRLRSSTVPSLSPAFESPDKVGRPAVSEPRDNATASAIAATAASDVLRRQFQLESATGGTTGSANQTGGMQGNATSTSRDVTASLGSGRSRRLNQLVLKFSGTPDQGQYNPTATGEAALIKQQYQRDVAESLITASDGNLTASLQLSQLESATGGGANRTGSMQGNATATRTSGTRRLLV